MLEKSVYFLQTMLVFYYFSTALQWYSYKLKRVLFHFSKPIWHLIFFVLPLVVIAIAGIFGKPIWAGLFLIISCISMIKWTKKLDKKLIFTARVKRFWGIFVAIVLPFTYILHADYQAASALIAIFGAYYISGEVESRIVAKGFEKKAKEKLLSINPIVVAITASFGKTSIKNFVAHIISKQFRTYATPASVNTTMGIVKDINDALAQDTQVYIVEAGARAKGDIAEIAALVNPQYAIIGKIGEAHIEYFKTIENIRATKAEILDSSALKKAFVYENSGAEGENIVVFGYEKGIQIKNAASTLDGVSFEMELDGETQKFEAPNLLGGFNAINIAAAVLLAKELGMDTEAIKRAVNTLPSVPHRLQKITAGQKIILDDSFNGNIDGIKEGIELCRTHPHQKVIVTCGLVESRDELNIELAKLIDEVFDVAIITGELNKKLFDENLEKCEKLFLSDKNELENLLKEKTAPDSIVYFANDAPGYI
jgi:UDP-N-acetylmuramoyl-tripeptide--D-alanyl-D-alanine ligase